MEHNGARITWAKVTGDFFVHPEEGLEILEGTLVGTLLDEMDRLAARLEEAVERNKLVLIGFGPPDLAAAVEEALR